MINLPVISGKARLRRSDLSFTTLFKIMTCIILAESLCSVSASQITLFPNTSGDYTSDHSSSPVNNTNGLNGLHTTEVGNNQGLLAPHEMRSFLIFDTLEADASIVGATLEIGVVSWTTMIGSIPEPGSVVHLNLGLPTQFTAEQIAASHTDFMDPASQAIYNDLSGVSLGTIEINIAPNWPGAPGPINWYTATMPLGFVAAFNQARSGSARYLTISLSLSESMGNLVRLGSSSVESPKLTINTITVVPEPISLTSLIIGCSGLLIIRRFQRSGDI
jgi:hypothetical protein